MKIHNASSDSPLTRVFLQAVQLFGQEQEFSEIEEANVVVTVSQEKLRALYAKYGDTKFIIFLDCRKDSLAASESNVFRAGHGDLLSLPKLLEGLKRKLDPWVESQSETKGEQVSTPAPDDLTVTKNRYKVLVVDDKLENLNNAMLRLTGHEIITIDTPASALELLKLDDNRDNPSIDCVLTDLNMRPDRMYGALNLEQYGLSDEVPAGIAIMFEATKRGLPVAIVTDANHHQDFFSAMFDHVKGAEVNGQRVIFCQESEKKRWDFVLKRLMEETTEE